MYNLRAIIHLPLLLESTTQDRPLTLPKDSEEWRKIEIEVINFTDLLGIDFER